MKTRTIRAVLATAMMIFAAFYFALSAAAADAIDLSTADVEAYFEGDTPDRTQMILDLVVKVNGNTLTEGTHYTLELRAIGAGSVACYISGIESAGYTGTKQESIWLKKALDISEATFDTPSTLTFDRQYHKFEVSNVKWNGQAVSGKWYHNIGLRYKDAGTNTETLYGMGFFGGTKEIQFTIERCPIDSSAISAETLNEVYRPAESFSYTGNPVKPVIQVKHGPKASDALSDRDDYSYSYHNNTEPGVKTAYVEVVGKKNYVGTRKVYFSIIGNLSQATYQPIPEQTYEGSQLKPKPSISFNGKKLTEGTDYTLSYGANNTPGTEAGTVTATGKGAYTGSITIKFNIKKGADPEPVHVTGVKLNATSTRMLTNDSNLTFMPNEKDARLTLKATVSPADAADKSVKWSTSDSSVATVDSSGRVTGLKPGTVTITVRTVDGGKTATCKIQVLKRTEYKLTDGTFYTFQSRVNKNFAMDVMYCDYPTNTNVSLYKTVKGRYSQRLRAVMKKVNGHVHWALVRTNKTVGKRAVTELKGKNHVFGTYKETNWQLFRVYRFNDNSIQFVNRGSRNAISLDGSEAAERVNILPKPVSLDPAQRWYAAP